MSAPSPPARRATSSRTEPQNPTMTPTAPDALLFIASGCPQCPVVLQGLSELVKEGIIGRLEVVNVAAHPELAARQGVRAAPWTLLGPFELEGVHAPAELRRWAEAASEPDGVTDYVEEMLRGGRLAKVEALFARRPELLSAVLPLMENPELEIQVRLGVGAVLEGLAGSAALQRLVPELGRLSAVADHRVRTDACHYLGLSGSTVAADFLRPRLDDPDAEVREVAAESLAAPGVTP